jgi:hypothetical protein
MDPKSQWREFGRPFTPLFTAPRMLRLGAKLAIRVAASLTLATFSLFLPFVLIKTLPPVREKQERCEYDPEWLVLYSIALFSLGTVFLGATLMKFAHAPLLMTGLTVFLVSQVWLVCLIVRECHPEALLWTLLIPFFPWYFAYQRWDIAKWGFAFSTGGLVMFLIAVA